ncbi:MAG: hypothetical protein GVY26_00020 [Bacteroidetes bacterium]|jgi:hypothetical protein|nr:hypothetical protein [Bacteroidota bacterium]
MYSSNTGSRVFRFSNPDISGSFQGFITGGADYNNALMISLTACTISQFGEQLEGSSISPFHVFISGPVNVHQDEDNYYEYDSYYQGCLNGDVYYHWEISWDYQNTFQHLSFEKDFILDGEDVHPYMPVGYIRLTAVCSEGLDTMSQIMELKNWSAYYLESANTAGFPQQLSAEEQLDIALSHSSNNDEGNVLVFPNPASESLDIRFPYPLDVGMGLNIRLVGVDSKRYELESKIPGQSMQCNVVKVPSGFYVLEIQNGMNHFRSNIIISR